MKVYRRRRRWLFSLISCISWFYTFKFLLDRCLQNLPRMLTVESSLLLGHENVSLVHNIRLWWLLDKSFVVCIITLSRKNIIDVFAAEESIYDKTEHQGTRAYQTSHSSLLKCQNEFAAPQRMTSEINTRKRENDLTYYCPVWFKPLYFPIWYRGMCVLCKSHIVIQYKYISFLSIGLYVKECNVYNKKKKLASWWWWRCC